MDRTLLAKLWADSWDKGLWAVSWQQAIAGLTPQQAMWKPAPNRKSIWQMISHVTFWRGVFPGSGGGHIKEEPGANRLRAFRRAGDVADAGRLGRAQAGVGEESPAHARRRPRETD